MSKPRSIVFFLSYFFFFLTFWMVLAYLPLIFKSYGYTDRQIGFVIGLSSLSSLVLVLPMGVFSDYFSPKKSLVLGALCFSLYFLLLAVVKDFYGVCVAVIVGGVGAASIRIIAMSLYLKLIDEKGRGRKVAFLHLGAYLGFGSGPLMGGWLYEAFGPSPLVWTAFALSTFIVLLTFFVQDSAPVVFSFKDYREDVKKPDALFLIALVFFLGTHFGAEQSSISLLMKETMGLDKKQIGLVFFALGAWMAVLVPFAGILVDRRHRVFQFLLVGLLISSGFQFITPFATSFFSLVLVRMVHTMGDTLAILESDVLTARFFPPSRLGGNSGLVFCVRTCAIFLFAALSGWLNQKWGYKMPFFVNGIMVFAFSLMAVLYVIKRVRRAPEVQ